MAELMTQDLPSGHNYPFQSLNITSMYFAQILEYLDNYPDTEVERFYFDYSLVVADDPNIDRLLLTDLEFIVFYKKALTISENIQFRTSVKCPKCGSMVPVEFALSNLQFNKMNPELNSGINIQIGGQTKLVMMPTVAEFMKLFSNYRRYKRVSDMKLIKLIALFKEASMYPQIMEELVIKSTYQDITQLALLDQLFYSTIKPLKVTCPKCKQESAELDMSSPTNQGEFEVGLNSLTSNFFQSIITNNPITRIETVSGEVR